MDFFGIELEQPQTVRVEVRGGNIAWLARGAQPEGARADRDLVRCWVEAVNLGLFGAGSAAVKSTASVKKLVTETNPPRHAWEVELNAVDWGAFRVLRNLLLARRFEEHSVRTVASRGVGNALLDVATVAFPRVNEPPPFAVSRPDGDGSPEFCAEIAFGDPADTLVDSAIEALDLWAELVVFGGYAPLGMEPWDSGALPLGAILYDRFTVMQGFDTVFHADMSAFEAVTNYALALAKRGANIASVVIR